MASDSHVLKKIHGSSQESLRLNSFFIIFLESPCLFHTSVLSLHAEYVFNNPFNIKSLCLFQNFSVLNNNCFCNFRIFLLVPFFPKINIILDKNTHVDGNLCNQVTLKKNRQYRRFPPTNPSFSSLSVFLHI